MIGLMRIAPFALALVAVLAASPPAPAFSGDEQEQARQAVESGEARSLKDILRQLKVDGRVLDASLDQAGGRWVYRIKVLGSDGRVRVLGVDALSGKVLQVLEGGG